MPTQSPYVQAVIDAYWEADARTKELTTPAEPELPIGVQRAMASEMMREARQLYEFVGGPHLFTAARFLQQYYERWVRQEGDPQTYKALVYDPPFPEPPKIRNVWYEDRIKRYTTNHRGQMAARITARYLEDGGGEQATDDAGWAWWEDDWAATEVYTQRFIWYSQFLEHAAAYRATIKRVARTFKVTKAQLGLPD